MIKLADTRIERAYIDKLDGLVPVELCEKVISESTEEKKLALASLEKLAESRQAYYEAGYSIHELASRAKEIYQSPKATIEDKRLLLSYVVSNLTLNAGKIKAEYTLAFQFLRDWIPKANNTFEPQKMQIEKGESAENASVVASCSSPRSQSNVFCGKSVSFGQSFTPSLR